MTSRIRLTPTVLTLGLSLVLGTSPLSAQYAGWKIPGNGERDTSPVAGSREAAALGRELFRTHCTSCHGPLGKGDGPASNRAADLTDPLRVEINPEGVLFYKIWYGHLVSLREGRFNMPAFEGTLSREDTWAVVEHVKALRQAPPQP